MKFLPLFFIPIWGLLAQTSGVQFFQETTPGIAGIFAPLNTCLMAREFSFSVSSVVSPYQLFPYEKRVIEPAFFGEFGLALWRRYNLFLKVGLYPETEKFVFPWQTGIGLDIFKNEQGEHLSTRLLYGQLQNLGFHPEDPNLTAVYRRFSKLDAIIEFNKRLWGISFGLAIGYQYLIVAGSYWQEALNDGATKYYKKDGTPLANIILRRNFPYFDIGLGFGINKGIPNFGFIISVVK